MKLKVWVEVLTRTVLTEDVIEVDDAVWAAMTEKEREAFKRDAYDGMAADIVNGGCEEIED